VANLGLLNKNAIDHIYANFRKKQQLTLRLKLLQVNMNSSKQATYLKRIHIT